MCALCLYVILILPQLTAPDLTYTLIRPLEDKYNAIQRAGNKSVVFAFLLNRIHFLRDESNLTNGPLSVTRAALCELLAIRILRDNGNSVLDLVRTLTTSWPVWSGADAHVLEQARQLRDDDLEDNVGNAIELAIISKSRRFIKSSPCQRVIHAIWMYALSILTLPPSDCPTSGKCVYQAESSHAIISDVRHLLQFPVPLTHLLQRYKRTPVHFYDPHKAPLLDHYRYVFSTLPTSILNVLFSLKVPAIRAVLEYIKYTPFLLLLLQSTNAFKLLDPLYIVRRSYRDERTL